MATLWFNAAGILHDGIGLVLCDTCPCVGSSSESGSDSGSGSSVFDSSVFDSSSTGGGCCLCDGPASVAGAVTILYYDGATPKYLELSLTFTKSDECVYSAEDCVAFQGGFLSVSVNYNCQSLCDSGFAFTASMSWNEVACILPASCPVETGTFPNTTTNLCAEGNDFCAPCAHWTGEARQIGICANLVTVYISEITIGEDCGPDSSSAVDSSVIDSSVIDSSTIDSSTGTGGGIGGGIG